MDSIEKIQLHERLKQDCIVFGSFELCLLLLMNDSSYPWFILVPQIPKITEIYQLSASQQQQLTKESSYLAKTLNKLFNADKMNIAAIGNMVPQLHIHHIVRYQQDQAWPAPVWGAFDAVSYETQAIAEIKSKLEDAFMGLNDMALIHHKINYKPVYTLHDK